MESGWKQPGSWPRWAITFCCADILTRAALSDEFAAASGRYFDNDSGQFAEPHPDALDPQKTEEIVDTIEAVLVETGR